jgi:hypothetical protein
MTYVLVLAGAIERVGLPLSARRLDTGAWVLGLPDAPDELKAACGYFPVVEVPRPADTPTETWDYSRAIVNGQPTEVWTKRAKTPEELNPPKSPDEKLDLIKAELAALDILSAPIVAADILDTLARIQEVI